MQVGRQEADGQKYEIGGAEQRTEGPPGPTAGTNRG